MEGVKKKGSVDRVLITLTKADGWEDSGAVEEWKSTWCERGWMVLKPWDWPLEGCVLLHVT